MAEIKEECGVFGIYDLDGNDVTSSIFYGLTSLQRMLLLWNSVHVRFRYHHSSYGVYPREAPRLPVQDLCET